jgi:dihydroflavonol-4-reductase
MLGGGTETICASHRLRGELGVKVFLTGGTGFIGGQVALRFRERGDDVRALVRNRDKAGRLEEVGCILVEGSVTNEAAVLGAAQGCDAVVHGAAIYEVGIPKRKRQAMYDANVRGTETVLRAALKAEVPKVVYISTVATLGNTHGEVVDEPHEHDGHYVSYYDETKHLAHQVAQRLIDHEGLPAVIVEPAAVYGPHDHSQIGNTINQFLGHRLPLVPFPDYGLSFVHVEDVAEGVLLALAKGKEGEEYILGGENATMREFIETVAAVAGRKPPRRAMPVTPMKLSAPVMPVMGPLLGYPPNMREVISTADGVTNWVDDSKAQKKLGYRRRNLEQGLRDTLVAEGRLPEPAAA